MGNLEDIKDMLVDEMEPNNFDNNDPFLRRGCHATQGLVSNKKRMMNRTPCHERGITLTA